MTSNAFEELVMRLKQLPGLGARSAERIALHLLLERREKLDALVGALKTAGEKLRRCKCCGNLCEGEHCALCLDASRKHDVLCVVEEVPDLLAIERAGNYRGRYHVLHGKLSPLRKIGPDELNIATLSGRFSSGEITEVILALGNDIEGEATCHYLRETVIPQSMAVSRIGFGLPSGATLMFADPATLRSALSSRKHL